MPGEMPNRAHLVTGGFPPGSSAGHDHDYARLRLLRLLAECPVPASVANDFADVSKWLPVSRLLVTYVAGPYPDAAQCEAIRQWLDAGGHWLALHGTSGGRAERVEGMRQRRTVKLAHHDLLGCRFLTHPPICRFRVEVHEHPLTRGIASSFDVEDEPYFVELQDPASTRILATAEYGPDARSPSIGTIYPTDNSLQADGRTRVIGYARDVGAGGIAYYALGHCHNPAIRAGRPADATDPTPPTFHGAWQSDAFIALLRNAIAWGAHEPKGSMPC